MFSKFNISSESGQFISMQSLHIRKNVYILIIIIKLLSVIRFTQNRLAATKLVKQWIKN